MILLLEGTSDTARIMLAEKIAQELPNWKHIPIDELYGLPFIGEADDAEELIASLACHCAKEMQAEGFSIVLSYPSAAHLLDLLHEELGEELITIHLGAGEEETYAMLFNHAFDTSDCSVNELFTHIRKLIKQK
jgi:hypothetical protein